MSDEASAPIAAAEAPSNIALIKYMGKRPETNRALNSSLSLTLAHLRSRVEIWPASAPADEWQPLDGPGWLGVDLSAKGRERFLRHFEFLKQKLNLRGHFILKSANNFPSDCGIASSASSFAALTMATHAAAKIRDPNMDVSWSQLAELSRLGSGSSIRSFYEPFALWSENGCTPWNDGPVGLHHQIAVVAGAKKAVSSSEAHSRVATSLLFAGRPERAEERLVALQAALSGRNKLADWRAAFEIVWAEFWDMHGLFHTATPAFRYVTPQTLAVLSDVQDVWEKAGDGPLVTLDAGPNVHLLYRSDQTAQARSFGAALQQRVAGLTLISSQGLT